MSGLDVLILSVILLCAALGLITGFVLQLAGIVSVVLGIIAAYLLGPVAGASIERWVDDPDLSSIIGHVLVFSCAVVAVRVLAAFVATALKKLRLRSFDRLLGGVLGAVKGFAICAVIVVLIASHGKNPAWIDHSLLASPVIAITDWVVGKAKEHDAGGALKDTVKDLKQKTKEMGQDIEDKVREESARRAEEKAREAYEAEQERLRESLE